MSLTSFVDVRFLFLRDLWKLSIQFNISFTYPLQRSSGRVDGEQFSISDSEHESEEFSSSTSFSLSSSSSESRKMRSNPSSAQRWRLLGIFATKNLQHFMGAAILDYSQCKHWTHWYTHRSCTEHRKFNGVRNDILKICRYMQSVSPRNIAMGSSLKPKKARKPNLYL